MELDDEAKNAVRELGDAINSAIGESYRVASAIERLREIGYEPNLTLKLEIGLQELEQDAEADDSDDILNESELELTDEDLKTLRNMRIRFDK
jgi:hypothetical protein